MKKFLAILLVCLMGISMAACTTAAPTQSNDAEAPAADASTAEEPAAADASTAEAPAAGDAATKKTSDWVIGYICKDLSQQWFIDESNALSEACKELGAKDVILLDCGMDTEKYMNHLDNLIAQKVDYIVVCPPDQNLSQVTVEKCAAAGIPVQAIDDGLIDENGKHIAPALELDAYVVGQGMGEWLGNYINENLDLANNMETFGYMVMTMDAVSSCVPRAEGAIDAVKAISTVTIPEDKIIRADYDGTPEKGYDVAAATITAHPEITTWVITAPNDEGASGACRALETAGKDREAVVVGCGGYMAKDEFKKDFSPMKAASYFDPIEDGYQSAVALMGYLKDGTEPFGDYKTREGDTDFGIYPLGGKMVTPENYVEIMGKAAE